MISLVSQKKTALTLWCLCFRLLCKGHKGNALGLVTPHWRDLNVLTRWANGKHHLEAAGEPISRPWFLVTTIVRHFSWRNVTPLMVQDSIYNDLTQLLCPDIVGKVANHVNEIASLTLRKSSSTDEIYSALDSSQESANLTIKQVWSPLVLRLCCSDFQFILEIICLILSSPTLSSTLPYLAKRSLMVDTWHSRGTPARKRRNKSCTAKMKAKILSLDQTFWNCKACEPLQTSAGRLAKNLALMITHEYPTPSPCRYTLHACRISNALMELTEIQLSKSSLPIIATNATNVGNSVSNFAPS